MFSRKINIGKYHQQLGFSLIETAVALVTFGIFMSVSLPLFLYAQVNNQKSNVRAGALLVSQRVFENIRITPIVNLPNTDGNIVTPSNPVFSPVNLTAPTPAEVVLTRSLGRQYAIKTTFCAGLNTNPGLCNINSRTYKVEVFYNGNITPVYAFEAFQTKLQ